MTPKEKQHLPRQWPSLGPGFIVAAAFIGPGTVVTATTAGQRFGLHLVWIVVFSIFAAVVLQEMATRLGTLTGIGLGELLRRQFPGKSSLTILTLLVVAAIGFGNAAYQAGNLSGARYGLSGLMAISPALLIILTASCASVLLWFGSYKAVERVLVGAVALMGLTFVAAAGTLIIDSPLDWTQLAPSIPTGSLTIVMALVGTTLVPYNLFLHASTSSQRWSSVRPRDRGLKAARLDSLLGICAGGLVTFSILVASAASSLSSSEIDDNTTSNLASSLGVIVGTRYANVLFCVGVAAAGLSSAITAPLAGALAVCGILGWPAESRSVRFRAIWLAIMLCGVLASLLLGSSPTQTIIVAQAANMIALPVIAGILLIACNAKLLSRYRNTVLQNVLAASIVLFVTLLSAYKLVQLLL